MVSMCPAAQSGQHALRSRLMLSRATGALTAVALVVALLVTGGAGAQAGSIENDGPGSTRDLEEERWLQFILCPQFASLYGRFESLVDKADAYEDLATQLRVISAAPTGRGEELRSGLEEATQDYASELRTLSMSEDLPAAVQAHDAYLARGAAIFEKHPELLSSTGQLCPRDPLDPDAGLNPFARADSDFFDPPNPWVLVLACLALLLIIGRLTGSPNEFGSTGRQSAPRRCSCGTGSRAVYRPNSVGTSVSYESCPSCGGTGWST